MRKVVFVIVLNLIFSVSSFSQNVEQKFSVENNETTVDTVLGKLNIVTTADFDSLLVLEGRVLQKYELLHVTFEKKYDLKNSTVIIISTNAGGSGTSPSYYIFELFNDKRVLISKKLYSDDDTFKIKKAQFNRICAEDSANQNHLS